MTPDVRVLRDAQALATAAAELIAAHAEAAQRGGRPFTVALAGGNTPLAAYRELARSPLRERVDWGRCEIFFGDERGVPWDHAESNYRMAREALLDHVPAPKQRVHPMDALADDAAEAYAATLRRVLGTPPDALPVLDLVLLGVGTDGHTASIFPGSGAEAYGPGAVAVTRHDQSGQRRLTLTLATIEAARAVAFFVGGEAKAPVLARMLTNDEALPAARVRPKSGNLIVLADAAAAAQASA